MAITATFLADFDKFKASADAAVGTMKNVEAGGVKLQTAFTEVGAASDRTAPKVGTLRTSLQSFDGALASMGVNIGTEIRGLTELGEASGKTASQLGLIATAGFVVAAAMGGWKLGRLAAEFFDLDQKIASATAKMLGWGDLGGEVAGAKQDVVTRAIERGAAATISYSDALAFNNKWLKDRQGVLAETEKASKAHGEELKKLAAEEQRWGLIMAELNTAGGNWQKTLDGINGTVVEAVKFYLQAGVSQGTLATAYGLTAVQIKAVVTAMSEEVAMAKVLNDFMTSASANQATLDARAMASIEAKTAALREATAQAIAFNEAFLQNALATALAADKAMFGGAVDTSALHSGQRGPDVNQGGSVPFSGINTGAGANRFTLPTFKLPGFGTGGPVLKDGPIYAHQGEYVVPKGGGGGTTNVTIYVNGTAEDVARKVAAEILRTVKSGTKLGTA